MRKGKMVAQGAHASFQAVLNLMQKTDHFQWHLEADPVTARWLEGRFAKVCVSVNSEEELVQIYEKAKEAGIPCSIIVDSGKTEFHGVATKTAVAVGPATPDLIDPITGELPLL